MDDSMCSEGGTSGLKSILRTSDNGLYASPKHTGLNGRELELITHNNRVPAVERPYDDVTGGIESNRKVSDIVDTHKCSPTGSDKFNIKKTISWFTRKGSQRARSHSISTVLRQNKKPTSSAPSSTVTTVGSGCNKPDYNEQVQLERKPVMYNEQHIYDPYTAKASSVCSESSLPGFHRQRLNSSGSSSRGGSGEGRESPRPCGDDQVPRLVFIGDRHVGKTALVTVFTEGYFPEIPESSITPVVKKTTYVHYASIDKDVKVQFWDVDGGEDRKSIESCMRAHAAVVVYDVTNRSSFQKAQTLLETINPRISALLIANKVDLRPQRKVSRTEGKILARIHRVQYIEASCKLNFHIYEALQMLLASVPKEYMKKRAPKLKLRALSENHMNMSESCLCPACQKEVVLGRHRRSKEDIAI